MGKYEPPYTISNKMLELVSSISEKVGKISSHRELETRPHLRKNNRIRSIHSSLKIEANSLSLAEVRDVINGHLVLGDQKEIQEVKFIYNELNHRILFRYGLSEIFSSPGIPHKFPALSPKPSLLPEFPPSVHLSMQTPDGMSLK